MSPSDAGGARPDAAPALTLLLYHANGVCRVCSQYEGMEHREGCIVPKVAAQLAVAQAERDQLLGLAQTVLGDEADDVDDVVLHVKNALAILRTQHEALAARVQALAQQWRQRAALAAERMASDPTLGRSQGADMIESLCQQHADELEAALAAKS